MTIQEQVLQIAEDIYDGTIDAQVDRRLRQSCSCAVSILSSRLRQGLTYEDCGENFPLACALFAMSLLRSIEDGEVGLTSFDAGTLSLTFDSRHDLLAQTAEQLIAPWCEHGTAFVGVVS